MKKLIYILFVIFIICSSCTDIPDPNFERALIELDIDSDGVLNHRVWTSDISGITSLNVTNKGISDLTGIEDFTSLVNLFCYDNQLTNLNVSKNTNLRILTCFGNQLTSLDMSQNIDLVDLKCQNNQLTSLDVSQNTSLQYLQCDNNQITRLDVSQNNDLLRLTAESNQLKSLNLKNGNNSLISNTADFNTTNNPLLKCIEVDDPVWSTTNWTNIDSWTTFSVDCGLTYVPDDGFERLIISLGYDEVMDDYVLTSNISTVESLELPYSDDPDDRSIYDLTGLEDFSSLIWFISYGQPFTSIDFSGNTALTNVFLLDVYGVKSLDFSKNTALVYLDLDSCYYLDSLNISKNTALSSLWIFDNLSMEHLDLSKNTELIDLSINARALASLNLKNGYNTLISSSYLWISGSANLTCIQVDNSSWSTANWSANVDPWTNFSEDCRTKMLARSFNTENVDKFNREITKLRDSLRPKIYTLDQYKNYKSEVNKLIFKQIEKRKSSSKN